MMEAVAVRTLTVTRILAAVTTSQHQLLLRSPVMVGEAVAQVAEDGKC